MELKLWAMDVCQKSGADFSIEMARSIRTAMENWRGKHIEENTFA